MYVPIYVYICGKYQGTADPRGGHWIPLELEL